jgi:hypothetical protein
LANSAQAMDLPLPGNVARHPAGILDVLVAMQDVPHGLRLGTGGVPQVDREDERVAARIIVEDRLGRRIGKNAADGCFQG